MYSYINLTAMVLNCRLPMTRHINYIRLSWRGSLIKLLRLQLMVCFTQISRKTETGKNRNRGFLCKTEPKPNRKWNRRTVTALLWVDAGVRHIPPRPLHHQLKSKYGQFFCTEASSFVTL